MKKGKPVTGGPRAGHVGAEHQLAPTPGAGAPRRVQENNRKIDKYRKLVVVHQKMVVLSRKMVVVQGKT